MKGSLRSMTVLAILCAAGAVVAAQAPRRAVVIGCLQRNAGNLVINDVRGGSFRVEGGDQKDLDFHVGHKVELSGTFQKGAGSAETFRVESLVYIAATCQ